jgi:hypothetical protein
VDLGILHVLGLKEDGGTIFVKTPGDYVIKALG